MSDIAYRLLVDMSTRGSLAPQMERMGDRAKTLDQSFGSIGDKAKSAFSSVGGFIERVGDRAVELAATTAKLGAVGFGAGMAYGVTHLNNELEKTKISLGSIFNAQGIVGSMPDGMRLASQTIKEMRKDAASLPGEFSDLLSFFKLGATPAFQLGASTSQLEKMSAMGMAAAASTGVQMDQAAREFAQLLQGHAGGHNVFGQMLGFTGDAAHKFNTLAGQDRLKAMPIG